MIDNEVRIHEFQPLWLTITGDGPFPANPYHVDFTDSNGEPCNLFLLMSENGRGKTTILALMAALMSTLGEHQPKEYGIEELDAGELRVQWDVRVRLSWRGEHFSVVLSIFGGALGENFVLKPWGEGDLAILGAKSWHSTGFRRKARGVLEVIGRGDGLVQAMRETLLEWNGDVATSSRGFAGNDFALPTLLSFSAYRDIPRVTEGRFIAQPEHWAYRPAHIFDAHGARWRDSLDNLLVWLKWLDQDKPAHDSEGRFGRARKLINKHVFGDSPDKYLDGIRTATLEAVVKNGESVHRLDRLSSGEKNLVNLFLRIGAHMTAQTLILIDEPEVHLHPRWQHRLMRHLREFVRDTPGVTLIIATHSLDMFHAFGFEVPEQGLRKGGEVIESEME
ncbi:MAG: ATP-binding protein [Gammaproteobacteria bacterium]|nr:ATP-binding protein [Gammaproteobacteria bacterium]MBU1656366.1 ATP-binding protein [Gammaproteobacteria bacterium]MBU1959712.1 ATP-binding protein [Gammaproteobacteria bacterium]